MPNRIEMNNASEEILRTWEIDGPLVDNGYVDEKIMIIKHNTCKKGVVFLGLAHSYEEIDMAKARHLAQIALGFFNYTDISDSFLEERINCYINLRVDLHKCDNKIIRTTPCFIENEVNK
jgi:hypothetical protein